MILLTFLLQTIRIAIPYLLAAAGGVMSERVGIIALGLEGMMLAGAFGAALGSYYGGSSWIGLRTWRDPFNRASFIATWVITVFVGLLLRRVVFDRGIATAFIIVATITLGVLLGLGRTLSKKLSPKTS